MFDLSTLATKDTTELHLRHPVTEELLYADEAKKKPVTITLYGSSSKQYRNAVNAMQNRQLKRGKKQLTAEQMREEGIALLVACSDKATNLELRKGVPVDSDAAFRELYSDDKFGWLKDQVDEAVGTVANFLEV